MWNFKEKRNRNRKPWKSHPPLLYLPFLLKEWKASDRHCVYVTGNTAHIMTPLHQACLSYLKTNQYSLLLVLEFTYPAFNLITKPQCFEYVCQPSLSTAVYLWETACFSGHLKFLYFLYVALMDQDMPPLWPTLLLVSPYGSHLCCSQSCGHEHSCPHTHCDHIFASSIPCSKGVYLCSAVANTTLFKKKMIALISILTNVSVNPYKVNYQPSEF